MVFQKLYLIYKDVIAAKPPSPTTIIDPDLPVHPKSLQPYMNQFHFIKQCSNDIEIVRKWSEAVKNTIRRIKDTYALQSIVAKSAPIDYMPVIVPYLLDNINSDSWDRANEDGLLDFLDKVESHFLSTISKLNNEVMEESKISADMLRTSFNTSPQLSVAAKEELSTKLHIMLNDVKEGIDALYNDAAKNIKTELYAFFLGEGKPYSTMSSICHNNGNEIARRLNQIGLKKNNDFITLYESVFGL